jgi:hypothetical protein
VKKFLPTAVVLGLLLALGSYVIFFESRPADPNEGADHLFKVRQADITKFRLESPDKGTTIELEKLADGKWWITAPGRYEADSDAVDAILKTLSAPMVERRIGPGDPAEFGLDHPTFRATAETRRGKPRSFTAGRKNPTETAYFAQADGTGEISIVPAMVVDSLRKSVSELRSRIFAPIDPAKVTRLVVRRSGAETMEFTRKGKDAWAMARPGRGDADRYAVEGLLNGIKNLRGTDIIDETGASARYRLDDPTVRYEIYTGKEGGWGKPITVSLSRPSPKRDDSYATSSLLPFVMRIPGSAPVTDASKPSDDYRERSLLAANKEDLREAVIRWRGKEYTCRPGFRGKWSVVRPAGVKAGEELDDMLFEIIYVRAESFITDGAANFAPYGLAKPAAEITVSGKKDGKKFRHTYALGNRYGGFISMRWDGEPAVYGVREELLAKVARFAEAASIPPAAAPKKAGTPPKKK